MALVQKGLPSSLSLKKLAVRSSGRCSGALLHHRLAVAPVSQPWPSTSRSSSSVRPQPFGHSLDSQRSFSSAPAAAAAAPGVQEVSEEGAASTELNFDDMSRAYAGQHTAEIVRAILVFNFCRPFIVRNADQMLGLSRRIIGGKLTDLIIRETFFKHFCGGEDAVSIKPTVDRLARQGVGSILDYAAESDIEPTGGGNEGSAMPASRLEDRRTIICRTYTYEDEQQCDRNADIFKQAVRAVSASGGSLPFAAMKVTALGPPELLQRVSILLVEMRNFFSRLDLNSDGIVDREEWIEACSGMFHGEDADFGAWFDERRKSPELAAGQSGIDYVEWLETLTIADLPPLLRRCKERGPLSNAQLEEGEMPLLEAARRRAREIAEEAKRGGVRLLVDAEHTYFQPAIDLITNELMRDMNPQRGPCTVFNTYQAYLKDAELRLATDMERARRRGYSFGCKLVRGAYLEHETAHAKKHSKPVPIHDSLEDTHAAYNRCITKVLSAVQAGGGGAELMVASHNQASCEFTVKQMQEMSLSPSDAVYFGQLYGMTDHLTYTLGGAGFRAYKYLPWGPVKEVTPYLLRRAQENTAVVGGAKVELRNLWQELRSRLFRTAQPIAKA